MKSIFSRFKAPANGGHASRQSLDASSRDDENDGTVRGITRSRSILQRRDGTPNSSATSERASSSAAKDLPPRPITPGLTTTPGPSNAAAGRSVSDRIKAFEKQQETAPPPPPKDAPRSSGTFRRFSSKPKHLSTPSTEFVKRASSFDLSAQPEEQAVTPGEPPSDWPTSQLDQHNSDTVKKVMFRSPIRPTAATVTAGGPERHGRSDSSHDAQPGPSSKSVGSIGAHRRPSSPSRIRSTTPTGFHPGHQRTVSRSSSRASGRLSQAFGRAVSSTSTNTFQYSPATPTSYADPNDLSAASAQSYFTLPESWSAAMDEELIANLGPRERARQEVLWEIVNSEEKYVDELVRMNEAYCKPLLPQLDNLALPDPLELQRPLSPTSSIYSHSHGHGEQNLPIASRYSTIQSRTSSDSYRPPEGATPVGDDAADARRNAFESLTRSAGRAHPSQAPRGHQRSSYHGREKSHARMSSRGSITSMMPGPVTLPDDLEQVLTVIASGILEGHLKLITALRKRYDEQFPLVRNLADVFTTHSDILRGYATYILHLERALAQIDEAAAMADTIATGGRRSSRRLEETQLGRLSKLINGLEEAALPDGIPGLSISLSKPFQRLLKYPLLFQNLLYNTSPSTREYEATLAMVDEVQQIVRSIEDEKTSSEELERARDAWARIEGIDKHKALMVPKPTRLLVSESQLLKDERKSHRRLSDLLKHGHEKWIVRFSDVSLLCESRGSTTLPISTVKEAKEAGIRSESLTDLSNKRMSVGRRQKSLQPRNLYRFIKVYEWHERQPKPVTPPPRVSLEHFRRTSLDYRRTLGDVSEGSTPRAQRAVPSHSVPLKTVDGSPNKLTPNRRRPVSPSNGLSAADDESEAMSVMSYAFHGDARPKRTTAVPRSPPRLAKPTASSERRSSAKFAHRLRDDAPTVRPGSKVRRSLPPAMVPRGSALTPTDRNIVERPPWNSSTKSVLKERPSSLMSSKVGEENETVKVKRNLGGHI